MQLIRDGPTGKTFIAGKFSRTLESLLPKKFSAANVESSISVFLPTTASASVPFDLFFVLEFDDDDEEEEDV